MRRIIPLSLLVAALAWAAPAQAGSHAIVPPGNSGIDQYFETVPGVGGGVGVQHHKPTHNSSVSSHTRQTLSQLGANGTGAAAAADATTPTLVSQASSTGASGSGASSSSSSSPTTQGGGSGSGGGSASSSSSGGGSGSQQSPGTTPHQTSAAGSSGSPFGSLVSAVTSGTSGEGMGALQPIILLVAVLGGAGYLWHRRRRSA